MYLALLIFAFTRFAFLANYPHFFDAPEYLRLSSLSFAGAIASSHASFHPVSYLFWSLIRTLVPGNSVWPFSLFSAICGAISAIITLRLSRYYRLSPTLSLLALTFFSNTWLLETNLAHESLTHLLLLGCWYFWLRHLTNNSFGDLALALGLGGAAILNYPGLFLWLLLFPLVTRHAQPAHWIKDTAFGLGGIVLSWLSFLALTALWAGTSLSSLLARLIGQGSLLYDLLVPAHYLSLIHQAVAAFGYGYTYFALLVPLSLLVIAYKRRNWSLTLGICGACLVYSLSLSWWHGGLYGRLGGFVAFPLALGVARLPRVLAYTLLVCLLFSWLPIVGSYRATPRPELTRSLIERSAYNQSSDILIISDLERPQLEAYYSAALPLNNVTRGEIEALLATSSAKIFVTPAALDYPYRQYDGQLPHPLPGRAGSVGWLAGHRTDNLLNLGQ